MKIAWGITGAGHFLRESFDVLKELKQKNNELKVTTFLSRAAEEVVRMYGLEDELQTISNGEYLEELFPESKQGASVPKSGRFLLHKYDCLIITPATSNSVAKIAHGIADTLVTNIVSQAVKGSVPVYIVPVDIEGTIESQMPYFIDREICQKCELCPPREHCPTHAITDQIELLECTGCGECIKLCSYGAIRGGLATLKVRDVDSKNVEIINGLEGITVLNQPHAIFDTIRNNSSKNRSTKEHN